MDVPKIKGDVNKIHDQLRNDINDLLTGAKINGVVIFNNTSAPITFFAYNYVDNVFWVAAQKTLVAPQKSGVVAASGAFFKIHPDDKKEHEFLVAPGNGYVYQGPGDIVTQPK